MSACPIRLLLIFATLFSTAARLTAQPLPNGAILRIGPPAVWYGNPHLVVAMSAEGRLTDVDEGRHLAVSPDGKLAAAFFSNQHVVRLARPDAEPLWRLLKGHTAYVAAVAFSPDSRMLASGSNDRTLRLWDTATGQERHVCAGHDDQVCSVAFARDGKTIASASWDGTVRLWDVATGKELRRCAGHRYEVRSVAFAPDGATLASGGTDGTVRIWDAATAKELRRWTVHVSGVRALAFTKEGTGIFTADGRHNVRLWDAATAKELSALVDVPPAPEIIHTVSCAAFAPDGKTAALGHTDGTIRLHDLATGKELRVVGRHPGTVWSVAFAPDGTTLASSARRHGVVRLWDVETGDMVRSYAGHAGGVSRVLFTPDGKRLVAAGGSFEPTIIVYAVATAKPLCRLEGHTGYVEAIAMAPAGNVLVSAAQDNTIRVWDLATGKERRRWTEVQASNNRIAFMTDGAGLLAVDPAGAMRVLDVATGGTRRRLASALPWLAASPDSRTLAGSTPDGFIELVEVATNASRRRLNNGGHLSSYMTFSHDGRRLLAGAGEGTALLWDLTAGARSGLTAQDPAGLWRDLAGGETGRAYDACWKLALSPHASLPLLREQLRPVALAEIALTARWIAELDDDDFAVRQHATKDLENAGEGARAALEKALASPPSLEAKRRIESLLAALDGEPPAGPRLRELRALEVLEAIRTPQARSIVERLATGASGARLTREAHGTLERWRER